MPRETIDLGRITRERLILRKRLAEGQELDTAISMLGDPSRPNPVGEDILGLYRPPSARKAVIADFEMLDEFEKKGLRVPAFLEAGPRARLWHDPQRVRAAIVTTGGLAPGLHCVIHSIVKRHWTTYSINRANGSIFGVYDSFRGLCSLADNLVDLNPATTEEWLDQGGSKLGNVRYFHHREGQGNGTGQATDAATAMVDDVSTQLELNNIDILYVIGGDGSLKIAHRVALKNPTRSIVGIPKTMDNDILWVWQSFGFNTAVEQATRVINTMHGEAESTRRICLIELFGAESGFVAANAALASGRANLVLIPEVFNLISSDHAKEYLDQVVGHLVATVRRERHAPHAVVVIAEGVATVLAKKEITINGEPIRKDSFVQQLTRLIEERVRDARGQPVAVFINQPRHNIRAVPANAHDQIYCERLGALAVDNAIGGYTDFMISQWLSEYVLVPLNLVSEGQKSIPVNGMFWKQVVSATGQPLSASEHARSE